METQPVLNCSDLQQIALCQLLHRFHLSLACVAKQSMIPGSFFGDREAGLIDNTLYYRLDTPVHSVLHEAGHYICMSPERRQHLNTDAAGDYAEENGVCYLQILLAAHLPDIGQERMMQDMDSWGYSFRLGSAHAWFTHDAEDALAWLQRYRLVDKKSQLLFRCRGEL